MQVTVDINDDIYNAFVQNGVNVQEMIKAYIAKLTPASSEAFLEDKAYFQTILEEVESGKATLLSEESYEKEMQAFEARL
jgi:hypothetical protein